MTGIRSPTETYRTIRSAVTGSSSAGDGDRPTAEAATNDQQDTDERRTYVRVRPTDTPLSTANVAAHFRRLHALRSVTRSSGLRGLLGRGDCPPTIECLLVSRAAPSTGVSYYLGVDGDVAPDTFTTLLRGLFPDDYVFERVTRRPGWLDEVFGVEPLQAEHPGAADVASLTVRGRAVRRQDWQTQLAPFEGFSPTAAASGSTCVPLSAVVETLADVDLPVVYQALLTPKEDWTASAGVRETDLKHGRDTLVGRLTGGVFDTAAVGDSSTGAAEDGHADLVAAEQARLEELRAKDGRRSFTVNARAVAVSPPDGGSDADPADVLHRLDAAFAEVGKTSYQIDTAVRTGSPAWSVYESVRDRSVTRLGRDWRATVLRWRDHVSEAIVADAAEVGSFCALSGPAVTADARRGLDHVPADRTADPRPPADHLASYEGPGLPLGYPRTQDGLASDTPVSLPPDLQSQHVAWFGRTGAGKTTSLATAMLDNHAATDGADVLVDPKGDGLPLDYLRAHYERFGTLENVLYFDCTDVLPALSFFDIRRELAAGIDRATAVEHVADHYLEILAGLMGRERFERAVRSPDVIRYLVKALFDPVHGDDAYGHSELLDAVRTLQTQQTAPPVSDQRLESLLEGVLATGARSFDEIAAGVANRVEKISADARLATMFDHVHDHNGDSDADIDVEGPRFDFEPYLDRDAVIVFDVGGLRPTARRAVVLVVLSMLWRALKRRASRDGSACAREGDSEGSDEGRPLVNLYLEEAASVGTTDLLGELLAQARGFDCSLVLSTQFPGQFADGSTRAELLNNVGTVVSGPVPADDDLAGRLATADRSPADVAARLRALERGEWLASLPGAFGDPPPLPFVLESMDRPACLRDSESAPGDDALSDLRARTRDEHGLTLPASSDAPAADEPDPADLRTDSPLPYTATLPQPVAYVADAHSLQCKHCERRYDPSMDGMRRAIDCCAGLEHVDRESVPVCDLSLTLTDEELRSTAWSVPQLFFLQAVHAAQVGRLDELAYDIRRDSMSLLREYVGVDNDAVEALVEAGLLRVDCDKPHRLYSLSGEGRELLNERFRKGLDFGPGIGDINESSEHVLAVALGAEYLEREFRDDDGSPVERVEPYWDVPSGHRLDVAGLGADGEVVVALEAERMNNQRHEAIPEDFDKLAAQNPEAAIWVVPSEEAGHTVVDILHDPSDGVPRVDRTYSEHTRTHNFNIDADGLTEIVTTTRLSRTLDD